MTNTTPNPVALIRSTLLSHFNSMLGTYTLKDNQGNNLPSIWVYPPLSPQGSTFESEGVEILINRSPEVRRNTPFGINYAKFYQVYLIDHANTGNLSQRTYELLFKNVLEGTEVTYAGLRESEEGTEKEHLYLYIPESGINEFVRSGINSN